MNDSILDIENQMRNDAQSFMSRYYSGEEITSCRILIIIIIIYITMLLLLIKPYIF